MVKYYKVEMPTNVFYYEVNNDVTISDIDVRSNVPKDPSGNEIFTNRMYYTLGVLQTDAKATITQIDALPEGMIQ